MHIRAAYPNEVGDLSELAFRPKGYWPYDKRALEEYRGELEVFIDDILSDSVFVAEDVGKIVGFYGLSPELKNERLYFLFVEPTSIGRGIGRLLWQHAIDKARSRGWIALSFYADVYAKDFYVRQGCRTIGYKDTKLGKLIEMTINLLD